MRISIGKGGFRIVRGMASVRIVEGEVEVAAAVMGPGDVFTVPWGRALPLHALSDTVIEVEGGSVSEAGATIPGEWEDFASEVAKGDRVVVIGPVDSGKTFFTTFLANRLLSRGLRPAVVDADVGQSSIGPPATIGMAVLERPTPHLQETRPMMLYFVGSITPEGHLLPMVAGVRRLVSEAEQHADVVLVDTSGLVYGGPARALKLYKVESLVPCKVVGLQTRGEVEHILRQAEGVGASVHRLRASPWVLRRSRDARRRIRSGAFRDYFTSRRLEAIELGLGDVRFLGTFLMSGDPCPEKVVVDVEEVTGVRPVHCELLPEGILVVLPRRVPGIRLRHLAYRYEWAKVLVNGFEKGVLVGLYGDRGLVDIGVIRSIDFGKGVVRLTSPAIEGEVRAIKPGSVRLDEDFREVEALRPGYM